MAIRDFQDREFWNINSYGTAFKIQRSWILILISIICLITPCTNWIIPVALKTIKKGITIRYEK